MIYLWVAVIVMHFTGGIFVCSLLLDRGYVKTRWGAVLAFNFWVPLVMLSWTRLGSPKP